MLANPIPRSCPYGGFLEVVVSPGGPSYNGPTIKMWTSLVHSPALRVGWLALRRAWYYKLPDEILNYIESCIQKDQSVFFIRARGLSRFMCRLGYQYDHVRVDADCIVIPTLTGAMAAEVNNLLYIRFPVSTRALRLFLQDIVEIVFAQGCRVRWTKIYDSVVLVPVSLD